MKKYNNRVTAPLFYHSIFLYFVLPVNFITNTLAVVAGFNTLSYQSETFGYALIDLIFALIIAALSAVTFWGLRKWKEYSWYTIHAINAAITIYCLIVIGIIIHFGISTLTEFSKPLAKITVAILVSIYYWKRKGLFFDPVSNTAEDKIEEPVTKEVVTEENDFIIEEVTPVPKENKPAENDFIVETYPPAETKPAEKKKKPVALIVCAISLICSLIGNVYLYSQNAEIAHEAQLWSDMLDETQDDRRELLEWKYKAEAELDFYDRYAVIVSEYNNKYHKYDCELWDYPIWIYNIDAAKGHGYTPCSRCFSD